MRRLSLASAAWLVLKKDWQLEWRTRTRLTALIFFSLSTLLGLLLTPVEPRAIFLGKVFGNASLLFGLSLLLLPVSVALYDIDLSRAPLSLLTVLFLGSIGISAPGIVYSAISANARARDVMLPLLLFPVLVPLLLASVNATRFSLGPDPQEQLGSWLKLLTAFDLIYLSVGFLVFPKVVEED